MVLNNAATILCVGAYHRVTYNTTYYIYDLKHNYTTEIPVTDLTLFINAPFFTQDDNLLIIPINKDQNHAIFYNPLTKNFWHKKKSSCTNILGFSSSGEQYIEEIDNTHDHTTTASAVTLIDNNVKRMLNTLKTNDIPLVVCTIAEQAPGSVILSDEDYQKYITAPDAIQKIVNTSYIVSNAQWRSRLNSNIHFLYQKMRKPLFVAAGTVGILLTTYILLQKYPHLFNDDNKRLYDACTALLKLVTHL